MMAKALTDGSSCVKYSIVKEQSYHVDLVSEILALVRYIEWKTNLYSECQPTNNSILIIAWE